VVGRAHPVTVAVPGGYSLLMGEDEAATVHDLKGVSLL
jgi:hypothetical protein